MSSFLTRSGFGQFQPQTAQLPFAQFGGPRPVLPTSGVGGIAFPNAGQQPPAPTPTPSSPFLLPTGLRQEEIDALMGGQFPHFGQKKQPFQFGGLF